jgi:hypothetical protein
MTMAVTSVRGAIEWNQPERQLILVEDRGGATCGRSSRASGRTGLARPGPLRSHRGRRRQRGAATMITAGAAAASARHHQQVPRRTITRQWCARDFGHQRVRRRFAVHAGSSVRSSQWPGPRAFRRPTERARGASSLVALRATRSVLGLGREAERTSDQVANDESDHVGEIGNGPGLGHRESDGVRPLDGEPDS